MSQPGWYPDPAGDPRALRYWDGATWSESTAPADGTPPGEPGAPGRSRSGRRVGLVLGVAAASVVLATGTGLAVTRPWQEHPQPGGGKPPVASPTTPAAGTTVNTQLDCTGGSSAYPARQPSYTSYGVTVDAPADYTVRFDQTQWAWLQSHAAWGKNLKDPSGVALGGVLHSKGFGWDQALDGYRECLTTTGPLAGSTVVEQERRQTTVAGMAAQQATFLATDSTGTTWATLYVIDSGTADGYATVLAFAPNRPDAIDAAARVAQTIRKA